MEYVFDYNIRIGGLSSMILRVFSSNRAKNTKKELLCSKAFDSYLLYWRLISKILGVFSSSRAKSSKKEYC